jgi:glutamyl-tRNA synthetase
MKERATFLEDILVEGAYLIERPINYDEETIAKKWKSETPEILSAWKNCLTEIENFTTETIELEFKKFLAERSLGIGNVLPNFRLLLTGKGMGPSMFEIANFLGKEECLERMNQGLTTIKGN